MGTQSIAGSLGLELAGALLEAKLFLPLLYLHRKNLGRGNGQPVMILPGFMGGDGSVQVLALTLRAFGFKAHTWGQGRNHADFARLDSGVCSKLIGMHQHYKQPVALVGWSLGGRFALRLAHRHSDIVSKVVTIGSPLRTRPDIVPDVVPKKLPQPMQRMLDAVLQELGETIPPPPSHIPTTAIIGTSDKVVPGEVAAMPEEYLGSDQMRENIRIRWSVHLSMGWSARIAALVIDRLYERNPWEPFDPRTSSFGRLPLFFEDSPFARA